MEESTNSLLVNCADRALGTFVFAGRLSSMSTD